MNPESTGIKFTKFATKMIVGFGASKIAADVIKFNTRTPVKTVDKVTMTVAAFVIGYMVSEAAENYATNFIDQTVAQINEFKGIKLVETP